MWFQPVLGGRGSNPSTHTRRLFVLVQVALERERLAAARTRIRFVRRVCLDVCSKVGLVSERLGALRTAERTFTRVCADMTLEQPWT